MLLSVLSRNLSRSVLPTVVGPFPKLVVGDSSDSNLSLPSAWLGGKESGTYDIGASVCVWFCPSPVWVGGGQQHWGLGMYLILSFARVDGDLAVSDVVEGVPLMLVPLETDKGAKRARGWMLRLISPL